MVLPFLEMDGHLIVACVDPADDGALRAVERHGSLPLRAEAAEEESLLRAIHATYGRAVRAPLSAQVQAAAAAGEDFVRRVDELFFFFSSRRRHTRCSRDWSSDVCSSD